MPHIEKRIKPYFWAVFGALNVYPAMRSSVPAVCSGAIEQILNCNAIHRVVKPAKPCTDSIIAQFTQSTQANRGLIAGIFEAIGGAV